MKKNLFKKLSLLATAIFMFGLVINVQNTLGDPISSMSMEALAQTSGGSSGGDCQTGGLANKYCPYWNVSVTWTHSGMEMNCTTGGEFKCDSNAGGSSGNSGN
tara:strand:+ start:6051 stop:6359 length:309 start_codon:yes stop_codon:yes gene_type:complete